MYLKGEGRNIFISIILKQVFFYIDFLLTYALCLFGFLYYSHLLKYLLVKCPGSFTYGEAQVISQGVMLFLVHSILTFMSKVHTYVFLISNFTSIILWYMNFWHQFPNTFSFRIFYCTFYFNIPCSGIFILLLFTIVNFVILMREISMLIVLLRFFIAFWS